MEDKLRKALLELQDLRANQRILVRANLALLKLLNHFGDTQQEKRAYKNLAMKYIEKLRIPRKR